MFLNCANRCWVVRAERLKKLLASIEAIYVMGADGDRSIFIHSYVVVVVATPSLRFFFGKTAVTRPLPAKS